MPQQTTATLQQFRALVRNAVKDEGGYQALGRKLHISRSYLHHFLSDDSRQPGDLLLNAFGFVADPPRYRRWK